MKPYPVFLVGLDRRRSVVLGGGHEAERKVLDLLDCDARVTVIAPGLTPELRRLSVARRLAWIRRGYRPGDLRGASLVISTGQDATTNHRVHAEATAEGALVNVLDDVEHCSFVAGSVVRRDALVVSISTSGLAPAVAVRLRQRLERELGPEYADFLALLGELRQPLAALVPDFNERRRLWYRLADCGALELLRRGAPREARERLRAIVGPALETSTRLHHTGGPTS